MPKLSWGILCVYFVEYSLVVSNVFLELCVWCVCLFVLFTVWQYLMFFLCFVCECVCVCVSVCLSVLVTTVWQYLMFLCVLCLFACVCVCLSVLVRTVWQYLTFLRVLYVTVLGSAQLVAPDDLTSASS